jgi:hypothetical protein
VEKSHNQNAEWVGDAVLTAYLRIFLRKDYPAVSFATLTAAASYISSNISLTAFCQKHDPELANCDQVEAKLGSLFLTDIPKAEEYASLIYRRSKAPIAFLQEANDFAAAGDREEQKVSQYKVLVAIKAIGQRGLMNALGNHRGTEVWNLIRPACPKEEGGKAGCS